MGATNPSLLCNVIFQKQQKTDDIREKDQEINGINHSNGRE